MGALSHDLEAPHYLHHWRAGDNDNPYFGILGLADKFIVTADSISMLSEACATGKPVYMFDLGSGRHAMQGHAASSALNSSDSDNDFRFGAMMYRALMRWGWQPLTRDISLVHENLVKSGRASWLGHADEAIASSPGSDLDAAVAAVQDLF